MSARAKMRRAAPSSGCAAPVALAYPPYHCCSVRASCPRSEKISKAVADAVTATLRPTFRHAADSSVAVVEIYCSHPKVNKLGQTLSVAQDADNADTLALRRSLPVLAVHAKSQKFKARIEVSTEDEYGKWNETFKVVPFRSCLLIAVGL